VKAKANRDNLVYVKPSIKAGVFNCRSVNNKSSEILDHILDSGLDIVALTETWLSGNESDQRIIGQITPSGYIFHQIPRYGRKGGGVAIMCRDSFKVHVKPAFSASSFETMEVSITLQSATIRLIVVYRIPPNKDNKIKRRTFVQEFNDLLEKCSTEMGKLLIVSDFNVHWDNINDNESKKLHKLLDSYNLKQHIDESTHTKGHIIDWVISRTEDELVKKCTVDSLISDHHAIHIDLSCTKPHPIRKTVTYRSTKDIDVPGFKKDILESALYKNAAKDVDDKVKQYEDILHSLFDK
jgi:exonuclease III